MTLKKKDLVDADEIQENASDLFESIITEDDSFDLTANQVNYEGHKVNRGRPMRVRNHPNW